jgi:hypothetical protein
MIARLGLATTGRIVMKMAGVVAQWPSPGKDESERGDIDISSRNHPDRSTLGPLLIHREAADFMV